MVDSHSKRFHSRGFSLIEVLVTLVIIMLGLLGLLGVQVRSHQAEFESYQRSQALILMADMVQRINANRKAARCYEVTTDTSAGSPYVGAGGSTYSSPGGCSALSALRGRADADMAAWNDLLEGAAETESGASVGAMIGARGCVSYDAVNDTYRVSVAWQGLVPTVDPTTVDAALTCGKDQYGAETQRRIVTQVVRIANLK